MRTVGTKSRDDNLTRARHRSDKPASAAELPFYFSGPAATRCTTFLGQAAEDSSEHAGLLLAQGRSAGARTAQQGPAPVGRFLHPGRVISVLLLAAGFAARGFKMDKVLIVEDSQAMQRALQRAFTAEGYQVDVASDGLAGLSSFREQRPNAVLLDLKLPGMHGRELCREFKALAPNVPVIVLSANAEVDDKVLLLELGADDYVTKPFSPKELLARVRRAMRRTEAPASKDEPASLFRFADVEVHCDAMEVTRSGTKSDAHRAGVSRAEVLPRTSRPRYFARRPAQPGLGLPQLSLDAHGRQPHSAAAAKARS